MGDPQRQQADWEPGIKPSGLFWTIPVSPSALDYDLGDGRARFRMSDLAVPDYHDFNNAVAGGGPAPIPSHVSFDARWAGGGRHRRVRDENFGFEGTFVTGPATITFTTSHDGSGVVYTAVGKGQYNPTTKQGGAGSPAIGHERNGRYFR